MEVEARKIIDWIRTQREWAEQRRKECEARNNNYLIEYYKGYYYGLYAVENEIIDMYERQTAEN